MKPTSITLVCLLASAAPAFAEPPPDAAAEAAKEPAKEAAANVVTYKNDKLTAHVQGMPADAFLAEIAKQADAKLTGTLEKAQPVTADWTDIPLKEALEHVLGAQNFTLTYSEQGTLRAIQLKGVQQEGTPAAAEAPADPQDFMKTPEYKIFKAFDGRDRVPIEGAVAKRLGTPDARWDSIGNLAYADDDPAVRRSAVEAGMHAFEADESMRQAVMGPASGMSDAELAAFARARMYHRAEDFVRNLRRTTTLPDLRDRATGVLRELRKIPFEGPKPHEGSGGAQTQE